MRQLYNNRKEGTRWFYFGRYTNLPTKYHYLYKQALTNENGKNNQNIEITSEYL